MTKNITPQFLSVMRHGIVENFNLNEVQNLCVDLGVNFENLGGEGLEAKARELIAYLIRRSRLSDLITYCAAIRPNYAWPQANYLDSRFPKIRSNTQIYNKITILFLASVPTDLARVRITEEVREIQEKLQLARLRDHFNLQLRLSVRAVDITQALLDIQPQIVHFSGHGTPHGFCLEDQTGLAHPIDSKAASALFRQFANQIRCVLLNACYSKNQADEIAAHIKYVIGVNEAIDDNAAIAFTIGFYQALGAGRTIEDAYKIGCVQLQLQYPNECTSPLLISKR